MSDRNSKKLKIITIIAGAALVITAVVIVVLYKRYQRFLRAQIIREVTIEAGTPISPDAFFTSKAPNAKFITDISTIDTSVPQSYTLDVKTGKSLVSVVEKVTLNIVDTTAPTATAVPQQIYWDKIPDAKDVVTDVYDMSPVEISYVEPMGKETVAGERKISVRIADIYGNESIVDVPFTIIYDPEAPVITGTKNIEAFIGDSILYRDGVTVTDNYDKNPVLSIDTSEVDLTKEGVYTVTYIATDDHGNTSSATITLTLRIMPARYYDPEELYVMAAELIEKHHICNDDMSDMQKTLHIVNWVSHNMRYVRSDERIDWTAGAYDGLTTLRGDCYNYMGVVRAMLAAEGIESICLERYPEVPSPHYWNLVNIDGLWYHCDSCIAPDLNVRYPFICLYTDDEAKKWNYNIDYDKLPEGVILGTESLQKKLDFTGIPKKEPPPETPAPDAPVPDTPAPDVPAPEVPAPEPEVPAPETPEQPA